MLINMLVSTEYNSTKIYVVDIVKEKEEDQYIQHIIKVSFKKKNSNELKMDKQNKIQVIYVTLFNWKTNMLLSRFILI